MEGRGRHRRLSPFVQPRSLPRAPWSVNVTTPADDADGRGDDFLEGEVATPSVLIDHAPAAAEPGMVESEPDPAPEPVVSPPPSVASASGSTPGFAIASSPGRSLPVCAVARRSSRGRLGRKFRTARRERAFIGPVTPNGGLSGKRRRGRHWGSRAEPFAILRKVATYARRRRCPFGPVPARRRRWSRICTRHMRRRRKLRPTRPRR